MKRWLILLALAIPAWATPAFVQATSNCTLFGTSATTATVGGSSATTCPVGTGWTTNLTAGNLIAGFILRKTGSGTLSTVGDGGDACTAVNTTGTAGVGNAYLIYAFYCVNIAGGSKPTITLTFTVSENVWYMFAHEVSGVATSSPLDASKFVGQATVGAGTNAATTGNWTTTTNGDYIVGAYYDDGGGAPTITAGTTSQSWTKRLATENTGSEGMTSEDGVQTTASASTVIAFTTGSGSDPVLGAMAFKPPAGASTTQHGPWVIIP